MREVLTALWAVCGFVLALWWWHDWRAAPSRDLPSEYPVYDWKPPRLHDSTIKTLDELRAGKKWPPKPVVYGNEPMAQGFDPLHGLTNEGQVEAEHVLEARGKTEENIDGEV